MNDCEKVQKPMSSAKLVCAVVIGLVWILVANLFVGDFKEVDYN